MTETESQRDWREWAYLDKSRWPEAIPWMGPKREYGPYPWGQKVHHDPHDLDGYPNHHPNAGSCGDTYLGDVCPYCGRPLSWTEEVVTINGKDGIFGEITDVQNPVVAYHPACWAEREAERKKLKNTTLEQYQ